MYELKCAVSETLQNFNLIKCNMNLIAVIIDFNICNVHGQLVYMARLFLSKRCNVIVSGIAETNGRENWDDRENLVRDHLVSKLGMTTESVAEMEIDRAHRLQKNNREQGPRDIFFKPTKYKYKDRIIKEARRLRPEGIYFKEDYTDRVEKIRWQLRELLQDARKLEGVQAFLSYDKLLVLKDNARNVYTYDLGKDCVLKLRDFY